MLQDLFTYLPAMNSIFHSVPIHLISRSPIPAVSLIACGVAELEIWLLRRAQPQARVEPRILNLNAIVKGHGLPSRLLWRA